MTSQHPGEVQNKKRLRAFVALTLAGDARSALTRAITGLQREPWASGVRWVPAENLHLTLRFLGDIEEDGVRGLMDALTQGLRDVAPFECALDGVALFPTRARPRAISAGLTQAPALDALAAAVEAAVVRAGHTPETRSFRGHITLGRLRRKAERRIELATDLEPTLVMVNEVVLYQSTLDPAGASYSVLGSADLGAREGS